MRLSFMRPSRVTAGVILAGAMALTGAGTAWAAMSGSIETLSADGVSFTSGTWKFDPWPCNSTCYNGKIAGWNYAGNLKDVKADGHNVFAHGKIDGYGYATRVYTSKGNGQVLPVGQKIYASDPAQSGLLQVCTDKGTLVADSCKSSTWKNR